MSYLQTEMTPIVLNRCDRRIVEVGDSPESNDSEWGQVLIRLLSETIRTLKSRLNS